MIAGNNNLPITNETANLICILVSYFQGHTVVCAVQVCCVAKTTATLNISFDINSTLKQIKVIENNTKHGDTQCKI